MASEPLVHVSLRALSLFECLDPDVPGLVLACTGRPSDGPVDLLTSGMVHGGEPRTPTCPLCRIAWDTAVERAGGART